MISKIIFPDGSVLSSGDAPNAILSATLTRSVNDGTELTLGSVCSSMLEAELFITEPLALTAGTQVEFWQEEACMGYFTLEKPTKISANRYKLTACDCVSRLDTDLTEWLAGLVDWPYSLYKFSWMVCAQCGLELVNTEIPNGDYPVRQFSASGITGRQLMQWAGQLCGRFCRAAGDGQVEFAWYAPGTVSIGTTPMEGVAQGAMAVLENVPKGAVLRPVTYMEEETDSLTLRCGGKNLIPPEETEPYTKTQIRPFLKAPFTLRAGVTYTMSAFSSSVPTALFFKDSVSGDSLAYKTQVSQLSCTPEEDCQVYLLYYWKEGIPEDVLLQLEVGEATEYAAYNAQNYTVTFPHSVSGSFDWSGGILTGEETIRLEPVRIPALEGMNVLCSDCGETAVSYQQAGYYLNGLTYEDYAVCPVEKVQLKLTNTDVGTVYPDVSGGNTYVVSGNYLVSAHAVEDLKGVAEALYTQLSSISYTPCRVSIPANHQIRPGDILNVTHKTGSLCMYVMGTVRSRGRDTLSCTGSLRRDSVWAVNEKSYESLSGRVMELELGQEGLRAENRDAAGSTAALRLDVEGIRTEVSAQQSHLDAQDQRVSALEQTAAGLRLTVQTMETEGVSRVRTQTGYTFDEQGLCVSRSDSQLTNTVSHQGMYVIRHKDTDAQTVMLRADADGVAATDVTVGNYLVVGSHARFEDYTDGTDGRTACFYLGG